MFIVMGMTRMKSRRVCISAYDLHEQVYRRLVFLDKHIYEHDVHNISTFTKIRVTPDTRSITKTMPHSEDFPVKSIEKVRELKREEQLELLERIKDSNVLDLAGYDSEGKPILKQLNRRYYIIPFTGERSLGTVKIENIDVYKDSYENQRVTFSDESGAEYHDLKIVSLYPLNPLLLGRLKDQSAQKFARISFSRPFCAQGWSEDVCFMQISGLHVY